jgi:hypothetical protein
VVWFAKVMGRFFEETLTEGHFGGGNPAMRERHRFREQVEQSNALRYPKALSPLRSSLRCASPRQAASAVQKLRVFASDAQFENKPYGVFRRPR